MAGFAATKAECPRTRVDAGGAVLWGWCGQGAPRGSWVLQSAASLLEGFLVQKCDDMIASVCLVLRLSREECPGRAEVCRDANLMRNQADEIKRAADASPCILLCSGSEI